ncbi:MAG: cell division protein FtsW [Frankiales bacterium]|nr:cell division protein FtsW [Frankiales bacterium]
MTAAPTAAARSRARTTSPPAPAAARTAVLQRPLASYYLVLVSTGLLLAIGLVMVLSASSVRAYSTFGSPFAIAMKQGVAILLGLVGMQIASRIPAKAWRRLAIPILLGSLALMVLVLLPGIGRDASGARRWIPLPGGFNLQPSEFTKLGLALWGADLLVRKRKLLGEWKHLLVPLAPVVGFASVLALLEPDMGTAIVLSTILIALLWVVGAPGRVFAGLVSAFLLLGSIVAVAEPYRVARLRHFLSPCQVSQRLEGGFQACQGLQALGSGGWFGLGLGASREKWPGGLPNPYTDYVYAILGEELGLLGTLTVLLLFAVLIYAGIRIAKRTTDPFARLAAAGVTAWIAIQALVNIGTVVGLVPVTGIPLPLISFGGSAVIPTLGAIGMLLSFARDEPGARKAYAAHRAHRAAQRAARRGSAPARQ